MNPEASKAKKCLFGRPDHEELEKDLQRELSEDAQEMNEKWDFDFQKGKPLTGTKFEWEEVVEAPPKEKAGEQHSGGSDVYVETENKEMTSNAAKSVEEQLQHQKTPAKNPR